ncbi:MAG: hypothetical protein ACHQRJ_16855 [Alphaproteobacteria bacterium]
MMLRKRTRYRIGAALFLLVLVWVAAFGAYSGRSLQPPPISAGPQNSGPKGEGSGGTQSAKSNKRGTPAAPVVVEALRTPHGDKEAADIANAANEEAANGAHLVWLTGILGFVAALQWGALFWQACLLRRSVKVSESALTDLERPFVYAEVTKPGIKIEYEPSIDPDASLLQGENVANFSVIELCFNNFGRTPAQLTEIYYDILPAQKGDIVDPVDPNTTKGRGLPIGAIAGKDRPYRESENIFRKFAFDPSTGEQVGRGDKSIWVVGFIRYRDIFGNKHITGFCMVYDPIGDRFVSRGDENYNYARTEKKAEGWNAGLSEPA